VRSPAGRGATPVWDHWTYAGVAPALRRGRRGRGGSAQKAKGLATRLGGHTSPAAPTPVSHRRPAAPAITHVLQPQVETAPAAASATVDGCRCGDEHNRRSHRHEPDGRGEKASPGGRGDRGVGHIVDASCCSLDGGGVTRHHPLDDWRAGARQDHGGGRKHQAGPTGHDLDHSQRSLPENPLSGDFAAGSRSAGEGVWAITGSRVRRSVIFALGDHRISR